MQNLSRDKDPLQAAKDILNSKKGEPKLIQSQPSQFILFQNMFDL